MITESINNGRNGEIFTIWEQNENPNKVESDKSDNGSSVYEQRFFLDMNDFKEIEVQALQACLKVVECPADTAFFLA